MSESDDHPPYINQHNHDPRLTIYDPAIYELTPEASVYGNPYYSVTRPIGLANRDRDCVLFKEWGPSGHRPGYVTYPAFVDAKSGCVIVSERDNHRLQIFDSVGGTSRFGIQGCRGDGPNQFESPGGVTTTNEDYAKVAVADTGNRRVCLFRVTSDHRGYGALDLNFYFGHQIFQAPTGLDWDSKRNFLIVADQVTRRVSQHDLRTGQCVGEFRPPSSVPLTSPTDVAIDRNGLSYVTDADSNSVHVYERNGAFICRFGGRIGDGPGEFNKPAGLCFDRSSNLLIADEGNSRVVMHRAYDGAKVACAFERVVTTDVYCPKGVSVNIHENLVVCDSSAHSHLKIFKYK